MTRLQRISFGLLGGGAGAAMLAVALLASNAVIERALLVDPARTLGWGVTLFRGLLAVHGLALLGVSVLAGRKRPATGSWQSDSRGESREEIWRPAWVILIALTVIAVLLRLWELDSDLWLDEVLTLTDFVRLPLGEIVTRFPSQNQHMLYSVLARFSFDIFGESSWALRLPSVLFGVGSIWALFLLGRRIVGERAALFAGALMTASYHHIWFSQNARGYTGLLFFAILATWLWFQARRRQSWGWWIGYAAATALGMWTHLTMVFIPLTHAIVFCGSRTASLPTSAGSGMPAGAGLLLRPMIAWLLCGSLTLQLYALALPQFLREGLHEVSLQSEWTSPIWVLTESLRSLRIGFSGVAVLLCGGVMVAIGLVGVARKSFSAALALTLPALLGAGTMLLMGHNLWPRFFFFSMGFALLIVVHGALKLPDLVLARTSSGNRAGRFGRLAGPVLAGLLVAASAATVPRCYSLPKQDFSGARDYVERWRKSNEPVLAVGLAGLVYGRYFAPHWLVAQTRAELDAAVDDRSRAWLVYTSPIEVKAYHPDLWSIIETEFETERVFPGTLGGGEVYVCRRGQIRGGSGSRTDSEAAAKE
jgi:hypothetical protein